MNGQPAIISSIREFNRFYTRKIGLLRKGLLDSPYTLAEARLLFEIARRKETNATSLAKDLELDAGYLSRLIAKLTRKRLIRRIRAASDGRQRILTLTQRGRSAFADLDSRATGEIRSMLRHLADYERKRLVEAMNSIERLLAQDGQKDKAYTLRPMRSGDYGWVIHRHGVLYRREFGWDERFEALVARILADYVDNFDPRWENSWIAERDGLIFGCVLVARGGPQLAKLRLLLVEPEMRGIGLGSHLVDECIRFARSAGYKEMTLWTNHVLKAARAIYRKKGFKIIKKERHRSFGHDLVGETWRMVL